MKKESVCVGGQEFEIDQIMNLDAVRIAFGKTLQAQEYQVGKRRVKRPELAKLYEILAAAEERARRRCWDPHSSRKSRQVLLVDR